MKLGIVLVVLLSGVSVLAAPPPKAPAGPADASVFAGGELDDSPEWFRKTDELIRQLKDLVATLPPESETRAARLLQLAELQWQKAGALHRRAVREHLRKYDAWFEASGAARGVRAPSLSDEPAEKESDAVMGTTVRIYELIVKTYPKAARGDEAHFYLGQSYLQLTREREAVQTFKKLGERYPNSEYIPDAWLALGEYYFENKKLAEAETSYTRVTAFTGSKNWGYAKYKLAWTVLNLGRCPEAIRDFKEVVTFSMQPGQSLEYKDQALKDLVNAYTDCGDVDEAERYFTSVGAGSHFVKFLALYGARLFEQGRDDESIAIYRRLIRKEPMGADNLAYEGEILKAFIRKADRDAVLAQLDRIVSLVDAAKGDDASRQRDALEGTVAKYTREVFEEAKKLAGEQKLLGFQQAERFARYYLRVFPSKKNAYPIRMMQAESQYAVANLSSDPSIRAQKYQAAFETYLEVAGADPHGWEKGREFLALSAESAIFAAEEVVKLRKPTPRPGPKQGPRDLSPAEAEVVRACDAYAKSVPKGPKIAATRFKAARVFYELNRFDEALPRLDDVIRLHPATPQARFAADYTLDIHEILGEPAAANAAAKTFLAIPSLAAQKDEDGVEYRKTLLTIEARSAYAVVERMVRTMPEEAADGFVEFAKAHPKSDLVDEALYSAASLLEKYRLADSIRIREEYLKRFPNDDRTADVMLDLGGSYRRVVEFEKSTLLYERAFSSLGASPAKHARFDDACDALFNAAVARENMGEVPKAIANYRRYLSACDRDDAHAVVSFIAEAHGRANDIVSATKTFEEYIRVYGARASADLYLEANVKIADLLYESGKKKDAYAKYQGVVVSHRNLVKQKADIGPIGTAAAARSAFFVIEPRYDAFNAIKLDDEKTLAANLQKRLRMIKPLLDAYESVVMDYKQADRSVAALYQIGRLSEDLVVAVRESPIPSELRTETQKDLYRYELAEQLRPVEKAAVEYYEKCFRTSNDHRIYDDISTKAIVALERMRPSEFVPDEELRLAPGAMDPTLESSPILAHNKTTSGGKPKPMPF